MVVGAGQAGVCTSYFLKQHKLDHIVLERDRPFSAWHKRWDGFFANTPSWMNSLPGKVGQAFPGKRRSDFATRKELIDYFESYLADVSAPVLVNQNVVELSQHASGTWDARTTEGRRFTAENVVVCTGAMARPRVPELSASISAQVKQMHSEDYRRPADITSADVLVVGSGSSGVQITKELLNARRFREVHLATSDVMVLPNHILGIQTHRLLHLLGLFDLEAQSWLGRKLYSNLETKGDPIRPPSPRELARLEGLKLHDRLVKVEGNVLRFADGGHFNAADQTVIWCTGYKSSYGWVTTSGSPLELDARGYPMHRRGVVHNCPGLFFVGLRYQHTVASHDIYGVGKDAQYVVDAIRARCGRLA